MGERTCGKIQQARPIVPYPSQAIPHLVWLAMRQGRTNAFVVVSLVATRTGPAVAVRGAPARRTPRTAALVIAAEASTAIPGRALGAAGA